IAPSKITFAPYDLVAETLAGEAVTGITIVQGIFSSDDAYATPCAWFPADAAITHFFFSSFERLAILAYAPLNLNEPVFCRHSDFRYTLEPVITLNECELSSGVLRITLRCIFCDFIISSKVTFNRISSPILVYLVFWTILTRSEERRVGKECR